MKIGYPPYITDIADKVEYTHNLFNKHMESIVYCLINSMVDRNVPREIAYDCTFSLLYMKYIAESNYIQPEYSSPKNPIERSMYILINHLTR